MQRPAAVLWILLLITPTLVLLLSERQLVVVVAASETPPMRPPRPDCPRKCGDVEIPYPFGMSADCTLPGQDNFIVTCDGSSAGTPPRPYINNRTIEVTSISVDASEMRVSMAVSSQCYTSPITTKVNAPGWSFNSTDDDSPLRISTPRNELTAIGCYTQAFLKGSAYLSGCISSCVSVDTAAQDGEECAGQGCCQTRVPRNLTAIWVGWNADPGNIYLAWAANPCSYAFVAEKGWYKFRRQDLVTDTNSSFATRTRSVPVVLDWAIRKDGSCRPPSNTSSGGKPTAPACVSDNSYCVNDSEGHGYRCKCSDGYMGNPYLTGPKGCTNINECELRNSDPAVYEKLYPCGSHSTCRDNINGGYDCVCTRFHKGDGKSARGCRPIIPGYATTIIATLVAVVLLAVLVWFMLTEHRRRQRKGFFDKNGGQLLKGAGINIYTEEQLEKMTDRYSKPIGKGNFGHVFMGITEDNQRVAVKRAIVDDSKKTQVGGDFFHEIQFQFQMRHANLVRLVGCCLERDIPMLVFEFIPNGSLSDVLHGAAASQQRPLSLPERLDIAIGAAEALAYMHHSHAGDQKRIHGDVKSANILLDDNFSPKVSDFGSSKVMSTSSRYVRFVASDMNYVDPIYIKTYRFTEKSDVYSFGVVLLEIITRKPAKYDEGNSLPIDFVKSYKVEGNGRKMYDTDMLTDGYMECLDRIAELAIRCLKEDDDDRPTMAEVAEELKQVKLSACG